MTAWLLLLLLQQQPSHRGSVAATAVDARLEADGAFTVALHADVDALLLAISPATPPAQRLVMMESLRRAGRPAEAAAVKRLVDMLRRRLRVRFDGAAADLDIDFPERRVTADGELSTLGSYARLRGRAPADAGRFTFFASRSFRGVDLRVEIGERVTRQVLEPGEESAPLDLHPGGS